MRYSVWLSKSEADKIETRQFCLSANLSKEQAEEGIDDSVEVRPDLPRNPKAYQSK